MPDRQRAFNWKITVCFRIYAISIYRKGGDIMPAGELTVLRNLGEKRVKALNDAGIFTFSTWHAISRVRIATWMTYVP